ncbi:hypothetical protein MBANPS3_012526 [Mucor bainieri]
MEDYHEASPCCRVRHEGHPEWFWSITVEIDIEQGGEETIVVHRLAIAQFQNENDWNPSDNDRWEEQQELSNLMNNKVDTDDTDNT